MENCDKVYLTNADLAGLDKEGCRIARNACFAKSGRMFNDAELQAYFEQFDWYVPTYKASSFPNNVMNAYQHANIKLIQAYEKEKGFK